MILKRGNMWLESDADSFLFTGNSYVRSDGALVMGRGAALQALNQFKDINYDLGDQIKKVCGSLGTYGVLWSHYHSHVGVFQVKAHFRHQASLTLIKYSACCLMEIAELHKQTSFAMNFPGIGFGGLRRKDVLPILLSHLPDSIEVWEHKEDGL